jgi:hypothetical protein
VIFSSPTNFKSKAFYSCINCKLIWHIFSGWAIHWWNWYWCISSMHWKCSRKISSQWTKPQTWLAKGQANAIKLWKCLCDLSGRI